MKLKLFLNAFLLSLLFAALVFSTGLAQDVDPFLPSDDEVNDVARDLYCPVCENIPLDVCDTKACEQWREQIREKLAEGWTEEEIQEYFALQYGDRVLAEPPRRGFNWLIYILPPVFFVLGLILLVNTLRKSTGKKMPASQAEAAVEDEDVYLQKIEEELKRRKSDS